MLNRLQPLFRTVNTTIFFGSYCVRAFAALSCQQYLRHLPYTFSESEVTSLCEGGRNKDFSLPPLENLSTQPWHHQLSEEFKRCDLSSRDQGAIVALFPSLLLQNGAMHAKAKIDQLRSTTCWEPDKIHNAIVSEPGLLVPNGHISTLQDQLSEDKSAARQKMELPALIAFKGNGNSPRLTWNKQKTGQLKVLEEFFPTFCDHHHTDQKRAPLVSPLSDKKMKKERLLCEDCQELFDYASGQLAACKMKPKPSCKFCPDHCFDEAHRQRMKEVMKWTGMHFVRKGRLDWCLKYFMG